MTYLEAGRRTTFFEAGTPAGPGEALSHYKRALAEIEPGARPTWRLDPANAGLLSRAAGELAARGAAGLDVLLDATDISEYETVVADEGALVPVLRRLIDKRAAGFDIAPSLGDAGGRGRPYVLPPPSLDISTNDLCGLKCVMCANRNERRDPLTMSVEDVRGLLQEAADWGIRRVALTGAGEPFRDPAILDHLDAASALGHFVTVTTNGLPVREDVAERVARLDGSLSVSIHGATDATHDAITGVHGSGEHAWTAVRRLCAARDRLGRRGKFFVNVSTVIQRGNVEEMLDLAERSLAEGCDGHNLQPVNLQHGAFREGRVVRRDDAALASALWPLPEQAPALDRAFEGLIALRRERGHVRTTEDRLALFRRYFDDPSREALGVTCRVGERFLAVDHRGRVKPCYRLPWDLGDARVRKVQRLWNSRAYGRVRGVVADCPLTCMNNCFFRTKA